MLAKKGLVDVVLTMYNFSMEKAVEAAIAEASKAGIGIAGMKVMAGGQFALGREEYAKLPRELANVRCRDCEHCTVNCPFGVQVATRLSRAQELFA